jgi:hypothetical protein
VFDFRFALLVFVLYESGKYMYDINIM